MIGLDAGFLQRIVTSILFADSRLSIAIWILFVILAGAGSAARTAAEMARSLQAEFFTVQTDRVERWNFWGSILSAIGIAGSAAVAVALIFRAVADVGITAVGAGLAVLIANYFQRITGDAARSRFKLLAFPLLGNGAALLPVENSSASSALAEESRSEPVEQMVDAVEKAGLIEMDEHQMITGIIRLDRTLVRDIMVPRIDVIAIDVKTSLRIALDVIISHAVSRVPVYEDSIDRIVGVLYAKDVLKALRDGKTDAPLRTMLRSSHFVPESKRVDELLQELQKTKVHLAIVVDEYGGTAGIVTIEDVLEEIVGEIQDEDDTGEEPLVERVSDNEAIFNARATIAQVNEAMAINLPDESDTLGGLVLLRLEKMPKVGDQVRMDGMTIAVVNMLGRRIKRVRVTKGAPNAASKSKKRKEARSEH